MTTRKWHVCALMACLAIGISAGAGEPESKESIKIHWKGHEFKDLSGVGIVGKYLVVVNDESDHAVHILEKQGNQYKYLDKIRVANGEEMDLEGVAVDKNTVYVIGSHSRDKKGNREKSREKVFRFELGQDGSLAGKVAVTSLHDVIANNPILKPAIELPPKKGGIDIEGIAVRDSWLYAGFAGRLSAAMRWCSSSSSTIRPQANC